MKYLNKILWSLISFCISVIIKPSESNAVTFEYNGVSISCNNAGNYKCNWNNNCTMPRKLVEAINSINNAKSFEYTSICAPGNYVSSYIDFKITSCVACPGGGKTKSASIFVRGFSIDDSYCCHNIAGGPHLGGSYTIKCSINSQIINRNFISDCYITEGSDQSGNYTYTQDCYYK